MKFPIEYNKDSMTLYIHFGKHTKYLQCPFATWWKARKYFRRPKFNFYFGPTVKNHGMKQSKWGEYMDYTQKGYWPMASTEYLKWNTPKWLPIYIMSWDISWKDKWNTPRYERPGYFIIFFGRNFHTCWQFSMVVSAPDVYCTNDCTALDHPDNYWESMLWYLHYADEYNEKNKTKDLLLARRTLRNNHWSRSDRIDITDSDFCDTKSVGYEHLHLGNNHNNDSDFIYIDIVSEKLSDYIFDNGGYHIYKKLISNCNVSLLITTEEDKKKYYNSDYVSLRKENDTDIVRAYFNKNEENEDLYDVLKNKSYKDFELSYHNFIDLGPTFKDEFLNKNGVKLVRENKEK